MAPDFRSLQRIRAAVRFGFVLGCLGVVSRPAGGDEPLPTIITVTPRIIIQEEEELLGLDVEAPLPDPEPPLIQDTAEVVEQAGSAIKKIDVPPIQVAIETKILRCMRPHDERSNADVLASLNWQHDASIDVEEYIKALSRVAETEVIAAPKLRSLHKQPAEIFVGERLGFRARTVAETGTSESVEFLESGTTLRFVPVVAADNSILIEVRLKHSTVTINDTTGLPRSDDIKVETSISAHDGQTIVIGGLITKVEEPVGSGQVRSNELIVLLTPHIVAAGGEPAIAVNTETPQVPVANRAAKNARAPMQTTAAKRQSLRYGGDTFEQWQSTLATQLKPEDRTEAMRAVGVFGANGYAEEATATILDVLNGYPVSLFLHNEFGEVFGESDEELIGAGQLALIRVGAGASPVLVEAIKDRSQKGYGRLAALLALAALPSNEEILTQTVLELLKDPRDMLSQASLECLGVHPNLSDLVVERLTPVIGDSTLPIEFRQQAVRVLANYGPAGRSAMPALLRFMDEHDQLRSDLDSAKPTWYPAHRATTVIEPIVIEAIGRIGPVSREAIVRLMQMLQEGNAKSPSPAASQPPQLPWAQPHATAGYQQASSSPSPPVPPQSVAMIEIILHNLPVESLEALTEILMDGDAETSLRELAVVSLEKMGSKAKPALPALRQFLKTEQPEELSTAATKAVETIARSPRDAR